MCVIMIADKTPVSPEMIEAGYDANAHGAGAAWRDGGRVHWKKGLDLQEIQDLVPRLPLPYILHFRISTIGGTPKTLTHPFEVSKKSSVALDGSSTNPVLFHNGHWNDWQRDSRELAVKSGVHLPPGKWSDSRAMAWCASILGLGFLDMLDQRIVVIGPKANDMVMFGGTWHMIDNIIVSNKSFEGRLVSIKTSQQREAEKKIRSGSASTIVVSRGFKHPTHCICKDCLEAVAAEEALTGSPSQRVVNQVTEQLSQKPGGASSETPFAKARKEYQQALVRFQEGDLSMSKNKLKKLKRRMIDEEYLEIKQRNRAEALTIQSNPRMLH